MTADSPLVGMSLGEAETLRGAPLMLALKTGNESRLAPPADARIWVGSVLGAMGERAAGRPTSRRTTSCACRTRLRNFGDLFNPSRAGISEAVVPPTSRYIGKTAARTAPAQAAAASACWRSTATSNVINENVRKLPLRAGDMLVLHSVWTDLAQAAASKDFVVVTDYPKGEQRPHKFKIAMAIFAVTILIALSSTDPGVDRADDRRRRHAAQRRADDRRSLCVDQLEDGLPDGLPDSAGLGDGFDRRRGVGRRRARSTCCRRARPHSCSRPRSRCSRRCSR